MTKNILIIMAVIITLLSLGGAVTYIVQRQEDEEVKEQPVVTGLETPKEPVVQPEEPITESIDTSDWKTYRNEKYGFEFKYPKEYDEVEPCKLIETDNGIELAGGRFRIEVETLKHEYPLEYYVRMFVAEEMQRLGMIGVSLDELAQRNLWIPVEKISVGGNEAFKVDLPGSRPHSKVFLSKGNKFYTISWGVQGVMGCLEYYYGRRFNEEDGFSTYEKMLSTFRIY